MKRTSDYTYDGQSERNLRPYQGADYEVLPQWQSQIETLFQNLFKEIYNKRSSQDVVLKYYKDISSIYNTFKQKKYNTYIISNLCFCVLKIFNICDEQKKEQLVKWTSKNIGVGYLFRGLILEFIEIDAVYASLIQDAKHFILQKMKKDVSDKEVPQTAESIELMAKSFIVNLIANISTIDLNIAQRRALKNIRYLKNASNLKDAPKVRAIDDVQFLKILTFQIPGSALLKLALVSKKMNEAYLSAIGFQLCNSEKINVINIPKFIDCMEGLEGSVFENLTTIFIKNDKHYVPDPDDEYDENYLRNLEMLVAKCQNLVRVTFDEVLMQDDVLEHLCKLPKIEVLTFNKCTYVDEDNNESELRRLSLLSGMTTLKRIDFSPDTRSHKFPKIFSVFKRLFITYPDGSQYEGELKEGDFDGAGTLLSSDGKIRETGVFEKGVFMSGITTYNYPDGCTYQGEVYLGPSQSTIKIPHGKGKRFYPDGSIEEGLFQGGHFLEGIRTILGTIGNKDAKYVVAYKKGENIQKGVCYFSSGVKYEGEFKDLLFHGPSGIMTFLDGSRYEGPFSEGQKHGIGKFFYPDGSFEVLECNRDVKETVYVPRQEIDLNEPKSTEI